MTKTTMMIMIMIIIMTKHLSMMFTCETRGPKMLPKVDCLPNAVGKQPSIPLINLGSSSSSSSSLFNDESATSGLFIVR